jgi:hypothetical protein
MIIKLRSGCKHYTTHWKPGNTDAIKMPLLILVCIKQDFKYALISVGLAGNFLARNNFEFTSSLNWFCCPVLVQIVRLGGERRGFIAIEIKSNVVPWWLILGGVQATLGYITYVLALSPDMYLEVRLRLRLSKERCKLVCCPRYYAAASEVQRMGQADHKQYSRSDPNTTKRAPFYAHNNFLTTTPISLY